MNRTAKTALVLTALCGLGLGALLSLLMRHEGRLEELRARTEIPSTTAHPDNRAAYYFEAARLLCLPPRSGAQPDDPFIEMIDSLAEAGFRWGDATPPLREFVGSNAPALEVLHRAMDTPECSMPIIFGTQENGIDAFETFDRLRILGRLLSCASAESLSAGRQREGIKYALLALAMGQDVMGTGGFEQMMTGNYLCRMGSRALAAAVTSARLSDEVLAFLEQELRSCNIQPPAADGAEGNDADWMTLYRADHARGFFDSLRAGNLEGALGLAGDNPSRMGPIPENKHIPADAILANCASEEWVSPSALKYTKIDILLVTAGIGVQRYIQEHGAVPEGLDALVPDYIPAVPDDPIQGGLLQCRTSSGAITIHSGREKGHNGRELTFQRDRLVPAKRETET